MYNDPGVNINPKTNDLWKPIVAAVNGMACGGALYMLGESDIIIAAEHATFFDPHVTYGMVAGFESVHLLQKLPLGEVLRIMLLGAWERMSAERAHQMGLVSEVVPQAELLERAMLGGAGHRLGAGHGHSGHAAGHLDDPRGHPARGAVAGLDLRRARHALRRTSRRARRPSRGPCPAPSGDSAEGLTLGSARGRHHQRAGGPSGSIGLRSESPVTGQDLTGDQPVSCRARMAWAM